MSDILVLHGSCGSVADSPSGGFNSSPLVTPSPSQSANKYAPDWGSVTSAAL